MIHLICGDPHIGKSLSLGKAYIGNALNSRIVDQINILNWILSIAVEKQAKSIIFTGDIFEDPKPHPTIIKLFMMFLKSCHADNIHVDIIHGNHDILRSGQYVTSALDVISEADIPNVNVFNNIYTKYEEGVCFTYLPFRDRRSFNLESHDAAIEVLRDKLVFELADIPNQYKKILIGHLAIKDSIFVGDEISDSSNELFCPPEMFKGYDYVWMGHIHRPQVLCKNPYVAHTGSMDISDFGESDHKKILIAIDTDSPNTFEEIAIPTRPLIKMTVSVPQGVKNTTSFVTKEITKQNGITPFVGAIVRVEVNLMSQDLLSVDRKQIEQALFSIGTFHIAGLRESKKISFVKKKAANISNISDINVAVTTYSDMFVEADCKSSFITLADSVIKEFKAAENK